MFNSKLGYKLNNTINEFETLAIMCGLNKEDRLISVTFMLKGESLSNYATIMKKFQTYEDAVEKKRTWYNSKENRTRIPKNGTNRHYQKPRKKNKMNQRQAFSKNL